MGIPKFYRWLSERYPLINQPGGATVVPVIDNFYLDMNGIIHNCTHGNDPNTKLTEEEMIRKIFMYLDKLFHIVKPQKLVFMAIDGVAPRGKMNQQRARRFKTAKEAASRAAEAVDEGPQTQEPFDSNCITPGTPFMERLASHLKFFIRHKMSEDTVWQKPRIVFSGHDVPGEGEHKIMEYLRWAQKSPDYEANTRHCLYGLDADLIMLALVTHEPHFCLLREVVSYKNRGQPIREAIENPSQEHFVLLQIGLLRDYFDLEFQLVASKLPFKLELERIIDDIVLFCMLVGNDFLPPLPTCDISEGSLDLMFQLYKELLPELGGYLTNAGSLHRGRLEAFLRRLSNFEAEVLEQRALDAEQYDSKRERKNGVKPKESLAFDVAVPEAGTLADLNRLSLLEEGHELELLALQEGELEPLEAVPQHQLEPTMMSKEARAFFESGDKEKGLSAWRERYYREKLQASSTEDRRKVVEHYIQGLHWVLEYYYRGVASWNWYYPYHYAPMVSDCKDLSTINVKFSPGRPFLPFEQLMAVQPASSCKLLPEAYRHLMTDPNSLISDFYPTDFQVDLEGKRAEWEGVVMIPFIDEDRLIQAMSTVPTGALTKAEQNRNKEGKILVFSHDSNSKDQSYLRSTLPVHFNDVLKCNSIAMERPPPPALPQGETGFTPRLVEGTKTGVLTIAGFPTLKTLAIYGELTKAGVDIFGMKSRKDSLILKFKDITQGIDTSLFNARGIAKAILNQRAWVSWPYVKESIVEKVSDKDVLVSSNSEQKTVDWEGSLFKMKEEYLRKHGVDLGPTFLVLHVRPVEGLIRNVDGSIEKRFSKETKSFPLQMTLRKNPAPDPRFEPSLMLKDSVGLLTHDFEKGSKALFLGKSHYGCIAHVVDSSLTGRSKSGKILKSSAPSQVGTPNARYRVVIETAPENSSQIASAARRLLTSIKPKYTPSGKVARELGVSPRALSRITGSLWVRTGSGRNESIDVGLYIRDGKKSLHVPDYCCFLASQDANRKGSWSYSDSLIATLKLYKQKFPSIWSVLEEDTITVEKVFPGMSNDDAVEELKKVKKWLSSQPSSRRKLVPSSSEVASDSAISLFQASLPPIPRNGDTTEMEGVPSAMLLPPIEPGGMMSALAGGIFSVGDRVVSCASSGIPPFGLRGTVVGSHGPYVEVLFDHQFNGGSDLDGRSSGPQGAVLPNHVLLNLSKPHALPSDSAMQVNTKSTRQDQSLKSPKIPDATGLKGFGVGRGRDKTSKPTNCAAPGKLAGMKLLGQLQQGSTASQPPTAQAQNTMNNGISAPAPPPLPSSSLLGGKQQQPTNEEANILWKLLSKK